MDELGGTKFGWFRPSVRLKAVPPTCTSSCTTGDYSILRQWRVSDDKLVRELHGCSTGVRIVVFNGDLSLLFDFRLRRDYVGERPNFEAQSLDNYISFIE